MAGIRARPIERAGQEIIGGCRDEKTKIGDVGEIGQRGRPPAFLVAGGPWVRPAFPAP